MTIQELIDLLNRVPNKQARVLVDISDSHSSNYSSVTDLEITVVNKIRPNDIREIGDIVIQANYN